MDNSVKKKLKAKCYEKAREILPQAIAVVEEEYYKPLGERVKLSHHLLMEKLNISSPVAWKALDMVARVSKLCVKAPTGPIYWNNDWEAVIKTFMEMFQPKPVRFYSKCVMFEVSRKVTII